MLNVDYEQAILSILERILVHSIAYGGYGLSWFNNWKHDNLVGKAFFGLFNDK